MKPPRALSCLLSLFICLSLNAQASRDHGYDLLSQTREILLLEGWKFQKSTQEQNVPGQVCPEAQISFDDHGWQDVCIPHDWAIAGPFDKDIDKQVVAIVQNGETKATEKTGRSGSLPWTGQAWYRRHFLIPEDCPHAVLVFDGAMSEPAVYINGALAGVWKYGYSSFQIDITPYIRRGEDNVLAVHLQNPEESSRWYPGAGLYRPVRLLLQPEIRLKEWGSFYQTTHMEGIDKEGRKADFALITAHSSIECGRPLEKGRNLLIRHTLIDKNGGSCASAEAKVNGSLEGTAVLKVEQPELWSPEQPTLYTLRTEILEKGLVLDSRETSIGLRSIVFAYDGFRLNGQKRKIKGVCLHHDLGPLGSAFNKAAFCRQVRILKDMGCDAIRTSHNMPAPWQIEICDSMGMMVMAESFDMWIYPKCRNGYARFFHQINPANGKEWWESDMENLVLCHRNHPSIILWSIGNEIPDQGNADGLKYTRLMQGICHRLDPSRPVTQGFDRADNCIWSGAFQATDIPGFNYRIYKYPLGLDNSPKGFLLGTETSSTISSRGSYEFPVVKAKNKTHPDLQCSGYDLESCSWSNLPEEDWLWQDDEERILGEFVWTGFDYLGEPTPYDEFWPSRSSYFGIVDLAGLPKDRYWLYRSRWNPSEPTIHLLPHWNWEGREGDTIPVYCYTDCPEAELFLNGVSLGRRHKISYPLERYLKEGAQAGQNGLPDWIDRYRLRWNDVRYEPGTLEVVVYDGQGKEAGRQGLHTAGEPHHIELCADRGTLRKTPRKWNVTALKAETCDSPDLCFVRVRIVDKDGNLCPNADHSLTFKTQGAARFKACCNGDATSTEPFVQAGMKAFHGELVVVLEASDQAGKASLTVSGKGLKSARLPLTVQ